MKKNIHATLLLIFFFVKPLFGQYVAFNKESNGTNAIIIPAGERWKIISYMVNSAFDLDVHTSTNRNTTNRIGKISPTSLYLYGGDGIGGTVAGVSFLGPAVIWVAQADAYYFLFEKKISDQGNNYQASTSVVIPTSVVGDVDVKMEQSADNVTWTECLPGTYNSSTVKRFFRLRAVEK